MRPDHEAPESESEGQKTQPEIPNNEKTIFVWRFNERVKLVLGLNA